MQRLTHLPVTLLLLTLGLGCGGGDSSSAGAPAGQSTAAAEETPKLPAGDPATLPKVPADETKITAMLRERFGDTLARTIRVEVDNKPEGLRVGLTGEVPNNEFRVAVMNEVEARVENIKLQDFNLEIAGPVRMLFGFSAFVRQGEYTYFAPDLSFAVTRYGNVYETSTGRRINRINCDRQNMVYMELSPDGKTLAASYNGGEVALFDMPLGRNRRVLQARLPEITFDNVVAMHFTDDCKQLVTISEKNGDVRLWDLAKGSAKQIGSHVTPADPHKLGNRYEIAISPDGKMIASTPWDAHEVFLWDVASRSRLESPKLGYLAPRALAWSHDGKTIAVARTTDDKRGVALYDVAGKQSRILATEQDELIDNLTFSPDDKTLVVRYESAKDNVRLWDVASGAIWQTLDDKKSGSPTHMQFSPDGAVLAMDCPDLHPASIRLWDVSRRPGASSAVAKLPPTLKDVAPQDDALAAEVERKIRGTFDPRNINALTVEVQTDGTIKLTGKVSDSEVKRVAQLEAEVYHRPEDIGVREKNKVINDLQITGKYEADRAGAPQRF